MCNVLTMKMVRISIEKKVKKFFLEIPIDVNVILLEYKLKYNK